MPSKSLATNCGSGIFLRVSVRTPNRGTLSAVQFKIADPLRREQGESVKGRKIPNSRYQQVVEIRSAPGRSKVRAVEVCNATLGQYRLTVYEHGSDLYRISVNADHRNSIASFLHVKEGRVRSYQFLLGTKSGETYVTWTNETGRPQMTIGEND
jgi:hypothetical protein